MSSGGDRPTESLSLNFTKILYEFNEMKSKNEKGDSPKAGWDIGEAKGKGPLPLIYLVGVPRIRS